MDAPGIDAKVAFLARREAYAERPRSVEVVETHFAWVFLTDAYACKLKKPIRQDRLDLTTPALRRHDCEEEVRLNRRLARDVYLGVRALCLDPARGLCLDGPGEAVDWLVWMRRLPADRMLDALIRAGAITRADVRPAAQKLAKFFASAPAGGIAAAAYRRFLAAGVEADRRVLVDPGLGLPAVRVREVADRQQAFLRERASLFDRRVVEGRIVEGHGDLRPEHVCLAAEPAVIDCLEFSRELRVADPADELAFLSLECERLGRCDVGGWFLDVYAEETGDRPPAPLLRFHRRYRALRRATLAAWHLDDPAYPDPAPWRACAREYLTLALAGPD